MKKDRISASCILIPTFTRSMLMPTQRTTSLQFADLKRRLKGEFDAGTSGSKADLCQRYTVLQGHFGLENPELGTKQCFQKMAAQPELDEPDDECEQAGLQDIDTQRMLVTVKQEDS